MVDTLPEIEELRRELAELKGRLAAIAPEISEEEVVAISAALAAYFGVRVHLKQIRLISSRAWAQEGRVSIQASHRLHG